MLYFNFSLVTFMPYIYNSLNQNIFKTFVPIKVYIND